MDLIENNDLIQTNDLDNTASGTYLIMSESDIYFDINLLTTMLLLTLQNTQDS